MRARELFQESKQEKNELADLVRKSENPGLLNKILNFLNRKVQAEQPPEENPNQPNQNEPVREDVSNNIKSQVLSMLDKLDDDSPEWSKIIDVLRKDEITALAVQAIQKKLGAVNGHLDKKLRDMVMRVNYPFEEKEAFLEKLARGDGYFDGKDFFSNQQGNLYDKINDPIAKDLALQMSHQFRGELGYGPDQGPGEIMMILMGKNIGLATKGDLKVGNKTVEVKATKRSKSNKYSGGRLYSTTGYGTSSTIKRDLYQALLDARIPQERLLSYGMPTKEAAQQAGVDVVDGALNLNLSGLNNLGELFKEFNLSRDQAQSIVKVILNGLYTKLPDGMGKDVLNTVQSNGMINPQEFLIEMTKLAHLYYMLLAGHDAVMIFNSNSGNYAMMETSEDVEKMLKSGTITLSSHISLDDDRGKGSSQIIIK